MIGFNLQYCCFGIWILFCCCENFWGFNCLANSKASLAVSSSWALSAALPIAGSYAGALFLTEFAEAFALAAASFALAVSNCASVNFFCNSIFYVCL